MKTAMEIAPIFDNENGEVKISGRQCRTRIFRFKEAYNDIG